MIFLLPENIKDFLDLWPIATAAFLVLLGIFGATLYLRSFVRKDANDANVENVEALKKLNETLRAENTELEKCNAEYEAEAAEKDEAIESLRSELSVVSGIIVGDVIIAAKKIDEKEVAMMQLMSDIKALTIHKEALERRLAEQTK